MSTGVAAHNAGRLRRFEQSTRLLFGACVGILLLEAASSAYSGPENFGEALLAWPLPMRLALGIGATATILPFTAFGRLIGLRLAALVLLAASSLWVAMSVGIIILYSFAMHGFD